MWGRPALGLQARLEERHEELNYADVIKNLIINEIEDRVIGKLQGVAERGQRLLTKKTGLVYVKPYL